MNHLGQLNVAVIEGKKLRQVVSGLIEVEPMFQRVAMISGT
jgi:hypothetical protein